MAGEDRTEKATPKRRADARAKGQVAKSADLTGAGVLIASLIALSVFAPHMGRETEAAMRGALALISTPDVVNHEGISTLLLETGRSAFFAVAPIAAVCLVVGVALNVLQVGLKPSPKAMKPDPKKLDPFKGAKNIFGPNMLVEGGKSLAKVSVVGAIAAFAVVPSLPELAALVGLPAREIVAKIAETIMDVAKRAAIAYLAIGFIDVFWQRHRTEKQMKMTKDEVKREQKDYSPPAEVKAAMKRRQMQAARARMMAAVPGADVVVTNPTHYSVALSYDGKRSAPVVVAKGQDLVALEIRRIADEHGVPIVPDAPLARSLHASVEIDREIPEELYQAVAQLLAFVYRLAGRRAAA
jgi:flagellar biosynthetic protein FlhB